MSRLTICVAVILHLARLIPTHRYSQDIIVMIIVIIITFCLLSAQQKHFRHLLLEARLVQLDLRRYGLELFTFRIGLVPAAADTKSVVVTGVQQSPSCNLFTFNIIHFLNYNILLCEYYLISLSLLFSNRALSMFLSTVYITVFAFKFVQPKVIAGNTSLLQTFYLTMRPNTQFS